MAILLPQRTNDDDKATFAAHAILQAQTALNDPAFAARLRPGERAALEQRIREAQAALNGYRQARGPGATGAMATTMSGNPAGAVYALAVLAFAAVGTYIIGNHPSSASLDRTIRALGELHRGIMERPPAPPAPPPIPVAGAGAAAAMAAMGTLIGSQSGLRTVVTQVERDIAGFNQPPRCSDWPDRVRRFQAAAALVARNLANPSFVPQITLSRNIQALVQTIAALYQCMGLGLPNFIDRG